MNATPSPERFEPQATHAMGAMFDSVSPRYRLLNRLMTLGQDQAWREAMWAAVPPRANVVLDLCTGEGSSLPGLRRIGRTVLGLDASPGMLAHADTSYGGGGWGPRLVCGDAFRLPLRDHSIDAVTVAFGMRNLRPQRQAVAEIARVLKPGGTLAVLEATLPRTGFFAPFHRFYVRRVVPLLGRLSPDPSAYDYLAASVAEFGAGEAFTSAVEAEGFTWRGTRGFLLGATRLWVARAAGESAATPDRMQPAWLGQSARGEMPTAAAQIRLERRLSDALQFALALALSVALAVAFMTMRNPSIDIPLDPARKAILNVLVVGGLVVFGVRTLVFLRRLLRRRPRF